MEEEKSQRAWELDLIRGIAILLMILFHLVFDLAVFFDFKINYQAGFWYYEGRLSAIIFILLAGLMSALLYEQKGDKKALKKNIHRGLKLIALGLIITLVTFFLAPDKTIWFGMLHLLGLSILITSPLSRYKWLAIFLALLIFFAYFVVRDLHPSSYLGIIFGLIPKGFSSYDHYALIPWLGYFLIGMAMGHWIYKEGRKMVKRTPMKLEKPLIQMGKYSLWIYLLHQPVSLGILWLFIQGKDKLT